MEQRKRSWLTRRDKVELFEQIRREHEFGVGTISGVSRKLGVHRRLVREALSHGLGVRAVAKALRIDKATVSRRYRTQGEA